MTKRSGGRHWTKAPPPGTLSLLVLLCVSCSDRNTAESTTSVADSAGIRIITIGTDTLANLPQRTAIPALQVGVVFGAAEEELGRVTDATVGPRGELFIADELSSSIKVFGPDGRFLREIGRPGAGPGEFRAPWTMRTRSDTLWVFDLGHVSVMRFLTDGTFIDQQRLDRFGGMRLQWKFGRPGPLGVPVWYEAAEDGFVESDSHREGDGPWRVDVIVARYGWDDAPELLRIPGAEHYWVQMPAEETARLTSESTERFFDRGLARHPLAAGPSVTFADDRTVVARPDGSLHVHDAADEVVQIIRLPGPAPLDEIPDDQVRSWAVSWWEQDRHRLLTRAFNELSAPQVHASVFGLAAGTNGNVWVAVAPTFGNGGQVHTRWLEIDRGGNVLRWVVTPGDLDVLEFAEQYVLGIARDELGVEIVVLLEL